MFTYWRYNYFGFLYSLDGRYAHKGFLKRSQCRLLSIGYEALQFTAARESADIPYNMPEIFADYGGAGDLLPEMKDLPFYEVVVEKQEDDA